MSMTYSVTVTDWTQQRGYRGSGRGWRVRCFGLPDDDWNALGQTVFEAFYRTEREAEHQAEILRKQWNVTTL